MNRSQAYALLRGIAGESEGVKNAAYSVVLDLAEEARDATAKKAPEDELPRWRISDPRDWVKPPDVSTRGRVAAARARRAERDALIDDPPATTEDGPSHYRGRAELLADRDRLQAERDDALHERDTLFKAAADVVTRIDRAGHADALRNLAEVIGKINREDS